MDKLLEYSLIFLMAKTELSYTSIARVTLH